MKTRSLLGLLRNLPPGARSFLPLDAANPTLLSTLLIGAERELARLRSSSSRSSAFFPAASSSSSTSASSASSSAVDPIIEFAYIENVGKEHDAVTRTIRRAQQMFRATEKTYPGMPIPEKSALALAQSSVAYRYFNGEEFVLRYGPPQFFSTAEEYVTYTKGVALNLLLNGVIPVRDAFRPHRYWANELRGIFKKRSTDEEWEWFQNREADPNFGPEFLHGFLASKARTRGFEQDADRVLDIVLRGPKKIFDHLREALIIGWATRSKKQVCNGDDQNRRSLRSGLEPHFRKVHEKPG